MIVADQAEFVQTYLQIAAINPRYDHGDGDHEHERYHDVRDPLTSNDGGYDTFLSHASILA